MKKSKRITAYCLAVTMLGISLCGCGIVANTGLQESDEELVAEYAAGVLMKYSAKKYGGLTDYTPTPAPQPVEETVPEITETVDATSVEEETTVSEDKPMDVAGVTDVSDGGTEEAQASQDLSAIIGIDGFDVKYTGYEIADVYPEAGDGELAFSMQSSEGKKLLVVHMDIINPDSSERECNVIDCNVKFRLMINETERVNQQMTILLNDLKSYSEVIPGGNTVDTVLVFEVDNALAESVESLSLLMINADGEHSYPLS